MKFVEIARNIDKSKRNTDFIDVSEMAQNEFDLNFYNYVEQDRLKAYYIFNWNCTDTWVGARMYFLDDEPVGISMQLGRKSDEKFEWFSNELAIKVRDYLIELNQDYKELVFAICNINDDIGGESFKIQFNEQIINPDKATLNNEPVEILEKIIEEPNYGIGERLKVKLLNGDIKEIKVTDLDFKFNLIE